MRWHQFQKYLVVLIVPIIWPSFLCIQLAYAAWAVSCSPNNPVYVYSQKNALASIGNHRKSWQMASNGWVNFELSGFQIVTCDPVMVTERSGGSQVVLKNCNFC